MEQPSGERPARLEDRAFRFQMSIQKSRGAVYFIACSLGIACKLLGIVETTYRDGLSLMLVGVLSALLLWEFYRRGLVSRWGFDPTPVWLGLDVALVTWAVYVTGGTSSPFFIWYLAPAGGAAFAAGQIAAHTVAGASVVAYLSVLAFMGHVRGLDPAFLLAAARMASLYGAAFFFLRGIGRLKEHQSLLRQLQEDEHFKLEELIRLTQDLDQGTRALAFANVQIREADRVKSQFLANMSHELRTPLNSIIGFSEILQDRLQGSISEKHVKFLDNIHSSGQHLLSVINDILDLSKVEAGKMEIHPESLPVQAVIEGVVSVMHGMAAKERGRIEVDCPRDLPHIETDPVRFKQILYNLLSNAIKFSPEGSPIRVVARTTSTENSVPREDSLTVSVIDRGIGIALSDQEIIFEEFRQADGSVSRSHGGTGLGLTLVKKFVEYQGGTVSLESTLGEGSTFSFTLPLRSRVAPLASGGPSAVELPWSGANRVLVVEDDVVAYQSLASYLRTAGYFPVRARHGEEALEMARRLKPTAITLDLCLPELSGWEILKQLKGDPLTKGVPVVIVSIMNSRELGLALGASDYFVKPVDRNQFIARLGEIAPPAKPPAVSHLLLVDDDPMIHELLDTDLTLMGYAVEHARSGREGVELATRNPPDAVILDLIMPDVTGFEVAEILRSRDETAHVPIVVLTAKELSPAEREALSGKIAAFVQKGHATPERLVAAIRELELRHDREVSGAS